MINYFFSLLVAALMSGAPSDSEQNSIKQLRTEYNCYPVYDYWGNYMYDDCYWE